MNYEEAGIKMISDLKRKCRKVGLIISVCKKGACSFQAIAYLKGMLDAGAITTEEVVEIKRKMIEVIKGE